MELDARHKLFLFLAGVFLTCLVVGDLIGGKLYQLDAGGLSLTISVGMIPFPVVFLLTDLINEFYGQRAARWVTLVGFVMAWMTIGILALATAVPWAPQTREPGWGGVVQPAFDNVFNSSTRILMASTAAYLIAQLIDIGIFHLLKRKTGGRYLWLRATGSTVVSQGIDTVTIQFLAWWGILPLGDIVSIIVTSYLVKVVVAIALTPAIYAGHALVERVLEIEPVAADADA